MLPSLVLCLIFQKKGKERKRKEKRRTNLIFPYVHRIFQNEKKEKKEGKRKKEREKRKEKEGKKKKKKVPFDFAFHCVVSDLPGKFSKNLS